MIQLQYKYRIAKPSGKGVNHSACSYMLFVKFLKTPLTQQQFWQFWFHGFLTHLCRVRTSLEPNPGDAMRSRGENRLWGRSGCGPWPKVWCIQYVKYLITEQNSTISGASHQLPQNSPGSCLRGKISITKWLNYWALCQPGA